MTDNIVRFHQLIGGAIGLTIWLGLLEGPKMKGVLFRKNSDGKTIFTPQNIFKFIKAPFTHSFFWTPSFFTHNWIVMTSVGIIAGYTYTWHIKNVINCYNL